MPDQPDFSAALAAAIVQQRYGMAVRVEPLPSYDDQNFLMQDAGGSRWVFKIFRLGTPAALIDLEIALMRHLRQPGLAPLCPAVQPDSAGRSVLTVSHPSGRRYQARLISFIPGRLMSALPRHSPALLQELGRQLGTLDRALLSFEHPGAERAIEWDLARFPQWQRSLDAIPAGPRRAQIARCFADFDAQVRPALLGLRRSVIHNDANDNNILWRRPVDGADPGAYELAGFIDFGDAVKTGTIFDLAICLAYALMGKQDPLAAAAAVTAGYHAALPLTAVEIELLYPLVAARLATSLLSSGQRQQAGTADAYTLVSQAPAWDLLARWGALPPALVTAALRQACGLTPHPAPAPVSDWLEGQPAFAPLIDPAYFPGGRRRLDLSVASPALTGRRVADMPAAAAAFLAALPADVLGLGGYGEARLIYRDAAFAVPADEMPERRTRHLGVDLFLPAGTPVQAPLAGRIHSLADNAGDQDYGPTIILEHEPAPDIRFWTLYGHLNRESLALWAPGDHVAAGATLGWIGAAEVNGGWPPHLHFQLLLAHFGGPGTFPGVAAPAAWPVWAGLCPDPNLILRLPELADPAGTPGIVPLRQRRAAHLGPSLSLSYRRPLHIVRGLGQYLYDADGREYLDGVNNVCHVGHCHPRVTAAAQAQIGVLNTNTRYLHENILNYAERLAAMLPDPLSVCFFVCSGSEANELALRLARAATGRSGVVVLDGAYHGNTAALVDISPYKFDGPGGQGRPDHVRVAPMPDPYRGPHRGPDAGAEYAAGVAAAAAELAAGHRPAAAFIAESLLGCGGQIVLPDGYLAAAFDHIRAAGGVCIADEVQVGFGRVGSHFWGFELQGVVPDIVTMGKPIGNGHPLAAVVTTPAIAAAFANGMEYFNTFGGNPVSCAVGLAVLDVIEAEGLQAHAAAVGEQLLRDLGGLQAEHALIGDVRGAGLFIGIELVHDRATLEPAPDSAAYVVERMRDHGILLSTDGPLHNVIKFKPPLVFAAADAERLVTVLGAVLGELD